MNIFLVYGASLFDKHPGGWWLHWSETPVHFGDWICDHGGWSEPLGLRPTDRAAGRGDGCLDFFGGLDGEKELGVVKSLELVDGTFLFSFGK